MAPSDIDLWHEVESELIVLAANLEHSPLGMRVYAVILEELDELWAEIRSNQTTPGRQDRMRKEAIQVAAMALRFIIDMREFSA